MAIEDIDLMTEEEMDIGSDPEMQDILKQLGAGEAQALMQLIKEFKEMVAKGFQGEFEDFVKIKMATAQGDDDIKEFQSEDEMIIEPDEMIDIEKQIVPTEMAAQGGIMGYKSGGGADFINTHKPRLMGNPAVVGEKMVGDDMREFIISNPDIEDVADYKSYYEKLKKKRKKKQEGGIMDVVEDKEVIETGPTKQEMIMDYLRERGLPITPENIQKAIIEMITGGIPYTERAAYDMPQMDQPSVLPRGMMVDESMMQQTPSGIASVNVMEDIIPQPRPYLYDAPPALLPFEEKQSTMFAADGGFADDMSVVSKVDPSRRGQIEGQQMTEDAMQQIINDFFQKFPEAPNNTSLEDMVAMLQFETSMETPGLGIIGMKEAADMITPESARTSAQAFSRHRLQEGGPISDEDEYEQYVADRKSKGEDVLGFDEFKLMKINFPGFPTYAAGGRVPYGLGSLVKKITSPIKKAGKSLVKSVKKFAKSDLGKAALMYMATAGAANIMQPGAASWASPFTKGTGTGWLRPDTVLGNLGKSYTGLKEAFTSPASINLTSTVPSDSVWAQTVGQNYVKQQPGGLLAMAGKALKNPMVTIPAAMIAGGAYTAANPGEENLDRLMANRNKEVAQWDDMLANIRSGQTVTPFTTGNVMFPYPNYYQNVAQGGRIGYAGGGQTHDEYMDEMAMKVYGKLFKELTSGEQWRLEEGLEEATYAQGGRIGRAEGGIMDLGGMEKDYRETGGFVPIGEYEKKDDVPARLSLNEFVMTADAVRGAGNGDIDKGAEVMEDMMETLEEQGQRHRQAQDMFSVSERLSEVVN